jgi:hypothetical protein
MNDARIFLSIDNFLATRARRLAEGVKSMKISKVAPIQVSHMIYKVG